MRQMIAAALVLSAAVLAARGEEPGGSETAPLTGKAAYGDWTSDRPGLWRKITPADLPAPYANRSASNSPSIRRAPKGAALEVPPGFEVAPYLTGLEGPRTLRRAPNGDIFVAEGEAGRVLVSRAAEGASRPERTAVFASGLDGPFGIAFYPPGPDPKWVYVADTDAVLRFPYANGDLAARGKGERIIELPISPGGHWTRDIAFSADGKRLYVSVGSSSNVAEGLAFRSRREQESFVASHPVGAAWGNEAYRADVLAYDPRGGSARIFATGLRNCVGLALHPVTQDVWCATNERDGLGDDLPPDYATRVKEGAFYGWPWYYVGGHQDPRHKGERPDLVDAVTVPDVLIQPHSAPLSITFYEAPPGARAAFPKEYDGDGFVALHGSWNRSKRTGYKVVRVKLEHGVPTGAYQDFLTGFVTGAGAVWGRPVGIAIAADGSLLVSDDGGGAIWRVSWRGAK
jgi:glucose/arabinose dehydrogenase